MYLFIFKSVSQVFRDIFASKQFNCRKCNLDFDYFELHYLEFPWSTKNNIYLMQREFNSALAPCTGVYYMRILKQLNCDKTLNESSINLIYHVRFPKIEIHYYYEAKHYYILFHSTLAAFIRESRLHANPHENETTNLI